MNEHLFFNFDSKFDHQPSQPIKKLKDEQTVKEIDDKNLQWLGSWLVTSKLIINSQTDIFTLNPLNQNIAEINLCLQ